MDRKQSTGPTTLPRIVGLTPHRAADVDGEQCASAYDNRADRWSTGPVKLQAELEIDMNEIANTTNGNLPATPPPDDPFEAYGKQAAADAAYLKFVKGEYTFGVDADVLPLGTHLVANMSELRIGWVKWKNLNKFGEMMVRLAEKVPPQRQDLDETDEELWELDDRGDRRDPWRFTNTLPLKDAASGTEYTFTTSSGGGKRAIGKLCRAYSAGRKEHPGKLAVVELQADSYRHNTFGKVHFPVFHIVGWVDEQSLIDGAEDVDNGDLSDDIPF